MNLEKPVLMKKVLDSLKIKSSNIKIEESIYIDKYDIELVPGVRYSKLENVLPDIGLALKAQAIPIGYPILNLGIYRIEVQKKEIASSLLSILRKERINGYAPITLGVDSYGESFSIDLQSLPNLLIGGTPGAGKSMLLHSIILSLIECNSELYLIDPKMVEFNLYEKINSVIEIENSVDGMQRIIEMVTELMNDRFKKLSEKGFRDVMSYNSVSKRKLNPIVIVVDEWADIILQNKKIQNSLCILAQKGRAAGISIILATQRPSSEVIPGLIKANFSGRISLRVASYRDSLIILDQKGGEKLKTIGTGLYLDHRKSEPVFFRSPFIKNLKEEIKNSQKVYDSLNPSLWKRIFG